MAAVWTDGEIDECITAAVEEYGFSWPLETTGTQAVGAGALTFTKPAAAFSIERVIEASGNVIPRRGRPEGRVSDERLTWEEWGTALIRVSVALAAQTLTIWYTTAPAITDIVDRDGGLLVTSAVVRCLNQRLVQDVKRGGGGRGGVSKGVIDAARREYERDWDRRRRRVKQTTVQRDE